MTNRAAVLLLPIFLVSCGGTPHQTEAANEATKGATMSSDPVRIQFAFMHFKDDAVRVTIDKDIVVNREMTVSAENERSGFAHFEQITMPACSTVTIQSKQQTLTKDVCIADTTKSITIDAGPPLTLTQRNYYQGQD